jgi:hypothetical protein
MNSLKKIALVMVATMTLGTIATLPAYAAVGTTLKVGTPVATGTLVSDPTLLPVPADNSVDSGDALQIAITGLDTGTVVSAVATNGRIVAALATPTVPVTASSGSASLSINTGTGTTADFYVYTTSVADGTVSVTIAGNTTKYYFKGTAGALNSITLTAPATSVAGTTEKVTVSGYDVFGNAKGGEVISLQVITTTSTTNFLITESATTATTVLGSKTDIVSIPTVGVVTLVATASVASAYTGLALPVGVVIKSIAVRDVLTELAAVKTELATEKAGRAADKAAADKAAADAKTASDAALVKALADAKVLSDKALADAKVASDLAAAIAKANADMQIASYKARFNYLATKWNKKHPTAKVALLK